MRQRPSAVEVDEIAPKETSLQRQVQLTNEFQRETQHHRRLVHGVAWFVAFIGLLNIVEAIFPNEPGVVDWMEQFLPMEIAESSRLGTYLTGFCLLAIARGVWRRKRAAWWVALVLLSLTSVLHLVRGLDYRHTILALVSIGLLIWRRKDFVAQSDRVSIRWALIIGIPLFVGAFLYGVIGVFLLKGQVVGRNDLFGAVLTSLELIFLQATDTQIAITPQATNFFDQVSAGGMISGLVIVLLLLRPVLQRAQKPHLDYNRIREIIDRHGCDPLDEFALLEDKSYFFTADNESFFGYALWRNYAVCLVGPIGPSEAWASAISDFLEFCSVQDWQPVFYCARAELRPAFSQCGLRSFKIGEDARLSVTDFNLKGGKFQNLRTACNKARKEGKRLQWYEPGDGPLDHGLEAQLKVLSDAWLHEKQGTEMTFDLGSFNLAQIRKNGVAALFNAEGRLDAFATWLPYKQRTARSLDLMRSRSDAKGVMDFLIVESIDHFKAMEVEEVSLGNAPLANIEENVKGYRREERAVKFLFENFNRYYGYKSLFEFKKKYQPIWQGRYLGFRPKSNLLLIALALVRVHMPQGLMRILRS
jgi:phosphatidylglycerol lysyltransferase